VKGKKEARHKSVMVPRKSSLVFLTHSHTHNSAKRVYFMSCKFEFLQMIFALGSFSEQQKINIKLTISSLNDFNQHNWYTLTFPNLHEFMFGKKRQKTFTTFLINLTR
jgi:hypothetical protein